MVFFLVIRCARLTQVCSICNCQWRRPSKLLQKKYFPFFSRKEEKEIRKSFEDDENDWLGAMEARGISAVPFLYSAASLAAIMNGFKCVRPCWWAMVVVVVVVEYSIKKKTVALDRTITTHRLVQSHHLFSSPPISTTTNCQLSFHIRFLSLRFRSP